MLFFGEFSGLRGENAGGLRMETSYDDGRITFGERREPGLQVKDPVCGMDVEVERAPASVDHEGRTYYFCSLLCKADFERQPDKYVGQER
jgi:YHS domain-containing protein